MILSQIHLFAPLLNMRRCPLWSRYVIPIHNYYDVYSLLHYTGFSTTVISVLSVCCFTLCISGDRLFVSPVRHFILWRSLRVILRIWRLKEGHTATYTAVLNANDTSWRNVATAIVSGWTNLNIRYILFKIPSENVKTAVPITIGVALNSFCWHALWQLYITLRPGPWDTL